MDQTISHPLPDVGSFSYSWPTSKPKPQAEERVDHGDIAAFIGTDTALASQCSFDFRQPPSEQSAAMADADQMFLGGLLLPLQLVSQEGEEDGGASRKEPVFTRPLSLDSIVPAAASKRHPLSLTEPTSLNSSPPGLRGGPATPARGAVLRTCKLRMPSFGRCVKQHKWMSFRFLVPLYQKVVRCIWTRKATEKAMEASHRAEYGGGKVRLCDLGKENAIRDAILHCKRSL